MTKARSRLRVAQKALDELLRCDVRDEFIDTWYTYLVAAKAVHTTLEQGAKASAASKAWFEDRRVERKSDPLLQYMYESRNDDEHGLSAPVEYQPPTVEFGENDGGSTYELVDTEHGSQVRLTVRSKDGSSLVRIRARIPMMVLRPVTGKSNVYPPPRLHKGEILDDLLPTQAAELNLRHLSWMIDEAEGLQI
ncbi:hypothetical protein [Sphingomonas sp. RIT328]|uniref:hypothetical protein n=1 Tax=Sphingomonas sp. RIT328 TaxID=1470591 RepID=UPI001267CF58|nr:hypothetical protein [Sphingomonas sp. RIT328]